MVKSKNKETDDESQKIFMVIKDIETISKKRNVRNSNNKLSLIVVEFAYIHSTLRIIEVLLVKHVFV